MNELKRDIVRLQSLVGEAFNVTGALAVLADSHQLNSVKLQRTLERTAEQFERASLEVRRLCERHSPGVGQYAKKTLLFPLEVSGSVEELGCGWLHITLNTLLSDAAEFFARRSDGIQWDNFYSGDW